MTLIASYQLEDGSYVDLHMASDGSRRQWWVEKILACERRSVPVDYGAARYHYRRAAKRGYTYRSLPGHGEYGPLGKDVHTDEKRG